MATRLEIQARRQALTESIRRSCQDGTWAPGVMLPTVRELGDQHEVSANVVFQVIQNLVDEGVLYTVPRVGAFVGRPPAQVLEPYLMVVHAYETRQDHYLVQIQSGFEDRIAQLGGNSMVLTAPEAQLHLEKGDLPPLAGIFEFQGRYNQALFQMAGVAGAYFGTLSEWSGVADYVNFDDVGGGAAATRHLWQNGHRNIAFLGLHSVDDPGEFAWSQRRETGWRQALTQAGESADELAFHPQVTSGLQHTEQVRAGREAALGLLAHEDITAVVVVNIMAAAGMLEAFRLADLPVENWPAIVCFDAAPGSGGSVVSYLRLPWEDIGREAAQVLWERRTGRLDGAPVQRLVPMRLIPRLTCRNDWAVASRLLQSQISGTQ